MFAKDKDDSMQHARARAATRGPYASLPRPWRETLYGGQGRHISGHWVFRTRERNGINYFIPREAYRINRDIADET